MKKIINGKKYNTQTAEYMGGYEANLGQFEYVSEDLYRKRTGEFFLYGEGGPASKYAEAIDMNSWSGGSEITPLTEVEAKRWAEAHLDADEYEEIFGEVGE